MLLHEACCSFPFMFQTNGCASYDYMLISTLEFELLLSKIRNLSYNVPCLEQIESRIRQNKFNSFVVLGMHNQKHFIFLTPDSLLFQAVKI